MFLPKMGNIFRTLPSSSGKLYKMKSISFIFLFFHFPVLSLSASAHFLFCKIIEFPEIFRAILSNPPKFSDHFIKSPKISLSFHFHLPRHHLIDYYLLPLLEKGDHFVCIFNCYIYLSSSFT